MTKYSAVIGAHYGDEGKGLVVDWLTQKNSLVVRMNGGAQAGHTVVLPNGIRHVFSHFGSGYFQGAATYLGPEFFVSPMLYRKECNILKALPSLENVRPKLYLNGKSPVVTPYDMLLNQAVERARGQDRHGSCGVGIYETWHRQNHAKGISLTVADLYGNRELLKDKLHEIRCEWFQFRQRELGLKESGDMMISPTIFFQDVDHLLKTSELACWGDSLPAIEYDHVIFEGAQGLLLDKDREEGKPHLTPSNTGIKNVLTLMPKNYYGEPLHVHYVSRTYVTRHGNGPLAHEGIPFEKRFNDDTNVTNEFQGSIRTAPLDISIMKEAISRDIKNATSRYVNCKFSLVFTHLDALPLQDKNRIHLSVVKGGVVEKEPLAKVVHQLEDLHYTIRNVFASNGPTRDHVFKVGVQSWH